MNASTTFAWRLAAAPLVLSAMMSIGAFAGTPSGGSPVSRSAKVPLKGIDLSTPEGAHAARERLRRIARRLCSEVADDLDLSHHANFLACIDETVSVALRKLTETDRGNPARK
jgi:UrcA family protein